MTPLEQAKEWATLTQQQKDALTRFDYLMDKVSVAYNNRYFSALPELIEALIEPARMLDKAWSEL